MQQLEDGIIELDSYRGLPLRFTSDRFGHGSYLWKKNGAIIISFIESLKRGNFRELALAILANGFRVEVPTPLARMEEIVRKAGYSQTFQFCETFGESVEVWVQEPAMKPPETKWDGIASSSTFEAFSRRRAIEDLARPTCAGTNMAALAYSEGIIDPKYWPRESLHPGACHGVGGILFGSGSGSSLSEEPKYEYRNGKLYQRIIAR